jgi:hypothetical protein
MGRGADVSTSTPHETNELRPFTVTVDGTLVTTGVEVAITANTARPLDSSWGPAVVRDGKTLMRISDLAKGDFRAWARVARGDETAVIDLGFFSTS